MTAALAFLFCSQLAGADMRYVGLTPAGVRIEVSVIPSHPGAAPTVLLIGGMGGNDSSVGVVREEIRRFSRIARNKRRFRLLTIPLANPAGGKLMFPPTGTAYRENAESNELWRWIGIQAPDFVIIIGNEDFGLADALSRN